MERSEWLAGLKVGDRVAAEVDAIGRRRVWHVYKVLHLTPMRTHIDIGVGARVIRRLDQRGEARIGGTWGTMVRIEPVTPEIEQAVRKRLALERLAGAVQRLDRHLRCGDELPKLESPEQAVAIAAAIEATLPPG